MAVEKIKLANKKWRHEQRRKQKRYQEKTRGLIAKQEQNRKRNERRKAELAYVNSLAED